MHDRLAAALAERYLLERELGRGGMATVYLARDLKHDRAVAVKVLNPEFSGTASADRFFREIRYAAGLAHPNILPLHDSGEVEGHLFMSRHTWQAKVCARGLRVNASSRRP